MDKILILGGGGHARSVADTIERQGMFEIAGYVVNDTHTDMEDEKHPVIGNDDDLKNLFAQGIHYAVVGIGFLGKSKLREKLYLQLKEIGFSLPVICDPAAIISKQVIIDEGTFIGKGAVINTATKIGKMCIINTCAVVEHGCEIGDYSHLSVSAALCGKVKAGREVFIGANATVIHEIIIGDNCILGAGATLKRDLKSGEIFK